MRWRIRASRACSSSSSMSRPAMRMRSCGTHQVRGGEQSRANSGGAEHRIKHGPHRALAVRAGDVDRAEALLGPVQCPQQLRDVLQAELYGEMLQPVKPLDHVLAHRPIIARHERSTGIPSGRYRSRAPARRRRRPRASAGPRRGALRQGFGRDVAQPTIWSCRTSRASPAWSSHR